MDTPLPESTDEVDLDAYFQRIGFAGTAKPTLDMLTTIHLAHATHIPFENLDIQLGRPIAIDLASIQDKLVRAQRGGYCFEQNTLLAAVIQKIGLRVTALAARVRLGAERVLPRTHMLLQVDIEGEAWLADVGFGTGGLLMPMRIAPGEVSRQFARSYRLTSDEGAWTLQSLREGQSKALYTFTLEPQHPIDFEMANHYVSTHPASRFVQTLAVQRQTPDVCYLLRNRELTELRGGESTVKRIDGDEALLELLAETFGLHFPSGTRFRCLQVKLAL